MLHNVATYGQLQSPKAPKPPPKELPTREDDYNGVGQYLMGGSVSGCVHESDLNCLVSDRMTPMMSARDSRPAGSVSAHEHADLFQWNICRTMMQQHAPQVCSEGGSLLDASSGSRNCDFRHAAMMSEFPQIITWRLSAGRYGSEDGLVDSVLDGSGGGVQEARPDFMPMFPW